MSKVVVVPTSKKGAYVMGIVIVSPVVEAGTIYPEFDPV